MFYTTILYANNQVAKRCSIDLTVSSQSEQMHERIEFL